MGFVVLPLNPLLLVPLMSRKTQPPPHLPGFDECGLGRVEYDVWMNEHRSDNKNKYTQKRNGNHGNNQKQPYRTEPPINKQRLPPNYHGCWCTCVPHPVHRVGKLAANWVPSVRMYRRKEEECHQPRVWIVDTMQQSKSTKSQDSSHVPPLPRKHTH